MMEQCESNLFYDDQQQKPPGEAGGLLLLYAVEVPKSAMEQIFRKDYSAGVGVSGRDSSGTSR